MVLVDAAIVLVLGFFVWRGMRRGLIATLAGFIGFLGAAAAAVFGYRLLGSPMEALFGWSEGIANLASALAIFIGISLGVTLAARTVTRALRWTKWGALNAAAGGALSGLWALTWVTLALLAASVLPSSNEARRRVDDSALAGAIVEGAPRWMDAVARSDLRRMLTLFSGEQR